MNLPKGIKRQPAESQRVKQLITECVNKRELSNLASAYYW